MMRGMRLLMRIWQSQEIGFSLKMLYSIMYLQDNGSDSIERKTLEKRVLIAKALT
jgi:hypothetical protein